MESETDEGILEKIITIRKKIREVTHELREWMSQDGSGDKIPRLERLYSYASRQLLFSDGAP
jgi:flagellin-specific chaperone FliS